MSDTNTHDTAIEAINEQLAQLDNDIQASQRRLEVDTAIRDRLLELRTMLSRKPRARRTRTLEVVPAGADAAPVVEPSENPVAAPWAGFCRVDQPA